MQLLLPILAILYTHALFLLWVYIHRIYKPPFLFVLPEDGSSFAPKCLIEFVIKDLSLALIKDLS